MGINRGPRSNFWGHGASKNPLGGKVNLCSCFIVFFVLSIVVMAPEVLLRRFMPFLSHFIQKLSISVILIFLVVNIGEGQKSILFPP